MAEDRGGSVGWPVFVAAAVWLGWNAAPDVGFCDGGELGTAAHTLGVPHPTGFPVDMLVAKAAGLLPLGTLGFRQNLASALFAAGALAWLAVIADRIGREAGVTDLAARRLGGWIACAAVAGWATFMFSAHELEVYSSALCAIGVCAHAALSGARGTGRLCLVLGLALGLHVTVGLVAGCLLLTTLAARGLPAWLRALRTGAPFVLMGALVVAYLPLASLRDPPLDWGDPQTLARLLDHLSGARIRSAFQAEMLGGDREAARVLLEQYFERGWLFAPAVVGAVLALRAARPAALGVLGLFALDLAYVVWVNPMGLSARQVGHLGFACVGVLAAVGLGWVLAQLGRSSYGLRARAPLALVLIAVLGWGAPEAVLADGRAASELHGSGGPLVALPARTVLLCSNDDACAGGLFAIHVERARPDLAVLPAQHLWDPTTLRRVPELRGARGLPTEMPAPEERAALAQHVLRELVAGSLGRPLFFEQRGALVDAGLPAPVPDDAHVPYLRSASSLSADEAHIVTTLAAMARTRGAPFRAERARLAWSSTYAQLGSTALTLGRAQLGVRLLIEALAFAPESSTTWTNLGVGQETLGNLVQAARSAERAIELAPTRSATPWVNLIRLQLRAGRADAARHTLEAARELGLRDPRLQALHAQLAASRAARTR